jgi:hypothetical protein
MGPVFLAADDMAGAWVHESLLIPFSRKRTVHAMARERYSRLSGLTAGRHAPNADHEIVRVCSTLS